MDKLKEDRWVEIQFYVICEDILKLRNDIMDVMDFISGMTVFKSFQTERVKQLANEMLMSLRCRPGRQEFCLICHTFGVPVHEIKRRTGIHNRILYDMLATEKENPSMFYPRMPEEVADVLREFLEAFEIFKKVGLM